MRTDTLPKDFTGKGIGTTAWDALDGMGRTQTRTCTPHALDVGPLGFSVMPAIMTYLHNATIDAAGGGYTIPRLWNQAVSMTAGSATVLLRADTGERIPHWVEIDHYSDALGEWYPRVLMIWPSAALDYSRRYIVAIRGITNGAARAR